MWSRGKRICRSSLKSCTECKIFMTTMCFTEISNLKTSSLMSCKTKKLLPKLEILGWRGCLHLEEWTLKVKFNHCRQLIHLVEINHLMRDCIQEDRSSHQLLVQRSTWLQKSNTTIARERDLWSIKMSRSTKGKTFSSLDLFFTRFARRLSLSTRKWNCSSNFTSRELWMTNAVHFPRMILSTNS